MSDTELKPANPPQRLCSEIQLFDLCDLDSCKQKVGRFCTNPDLLDRFEKIAEHELRVQEQYFSEDDDSEADYVDGYDEDDESFALRNGDGDENDSRDDAD